MSSGAEAAIEVRGLTKQYQPRRGEVIDAVRGVDLRVERGEIVAFLGANGAGKTTTIEILEGFRSRTGGAVSVLGHDPETAPRSWLEDIGIVLQESEPDGDLTARESLEMYAGYFRRPRAVDEVLDIVGLADHGQQRAKKLSGGQKRRLDLAIALVGDPKLLFLDEPTTGFDPSARRDAWGMIESLRDLGATVLLTTHYMDEAEHLADRIVVIRDGVIAAEGTAATLADQVQLRTRIAWDPTEVAVDAVPDRWRADIVTTDSRVHLDTDDVAVVLHALTAQAVATGTPFDSVSVSRPTLEDTFLQLNAQPHRGDGGADTE